MFIKVLDKDLANMIAAGEVVERPASAVKELCENSVDAGASVITIEIRSGGLALIKVTDNGCGIHPDDVSNAFLRHATSKISKPSDLDSIYTLGFRGEALASVAAVANVELYTRTQEFDIGMSCSANFGNIEQVQQTHGFIGTSIKVENLFYNTPARMKFLKKDTTESGYVEEVVRKTALAHPEVSFRFICDGKEKLFTPGDGIIENAVFTIYGKEVASQMLPISYNDGGIGVSGLVSSPVYTRKTRNMQTFFVNNRPIVSRMLTSALEEACSGQIPSGSHPLGVVMLTIPADTVDVNVHPAKLEVKFSDESVIYKSVYWAVKNAISKPIMPKILVSKENGSPSPAPVLKQNEISYKSEAASHKDISAIIQPGKTDVKESVQNYNIPNIPPPLARNYDIFQNMTDLLRKQAENEEKPPQKSEKKPEYMQIGVELSREIEYNIIGQVFKTYILVERGNDLIMIDQHAAHEHIVYARLLQQVKNHSITVQQMLTPAVISLTPVEKAFALQNIEFWAEIGFEIEEFGNNDIVVRGVPDAIEFGEIAGVISEIISSAMQNKMSVQPKSKETALYTVACRAAIKAGKHMTYAEMEDLAKQLFAIDKTITCPHGRPAWVALDKQFIEKQFKRIK